MSLLDTYRKNVQRKAEEIAKLQQDKAREQKKLSDFSGKINSCSQSISRTKTASTIQSKLREIERHQKSSAQLGKKIADFEVKIARKNKELSDEQKKVAREEEKELKKRAQEAEKQARDQQKRMVTINSTLAAHGKLHQDTRLAIEKLQQLPEKISNFRLGYCI